MEGLVAEWIKWVKDATVIHVDAASDVYRSAKPLTLLLEQIQAALSVHWNDASQGLPHIRPAQ
jgi:hypothetical protein